MPLLFSLSFLYYNMQNREMYTYIILIPKFLEQTRRFTIPYKRNELKYFTATLDVKYMDIHIYIIYII